MDENAAESKGVGIGRFIRLDKEPHIAEIAFTILDHYQRMGLGGYLTAILNIRAAQQGIEIFRYYVLGENRFVLKNLELMGILNRTSDSGILIVDTTVFGSSDKIPNEKGLEGFRRAMQEVEGKISNIKNQIS